MSNSKSVSAEIESCVSAKKLVERKIYLEVQWRVKFQNKDDEEEIIRVIDNIVHFHNEFSESRGTSLISFAFELEVDRPSAEFNVTVKVVSDSFISVDKIMPTKIDLFVQRGPEARGTGANPVNAPVSSGGGPQMIKFTYRLDAI